MLAETAHNAGKLQMKNLQSSRMQDIWDYMVD